MLARAVVVFAGLFGFFHVPEAFAQNSFPTPGGSNASGTVMMCLNGSNQAVPCTSTVPLSVILQAATASLVDRSGSISSGGTAQTVMASNASRRGWWLYNCSGGDLWMNEIGGTAQPDQPSFKVAPGAYYLPPAISTSAISIFGPTTGQCFSAREW